MVDGVLKRHISYVLSDSDILLEWQFTSEKLIFVRHFSVGLINDDFCLYSLVKYFYFQTHVDSIFRLHLNNCL